MSNKVTAATIIRMAQQHGFNPDKYSYDGGALVCDDADLLEFVSASIYEGQELPKRNYLVENFMIAGAPISLYGEGGIGKSLLSLQLAISVSLGSEFMGYNSTKSKVLYVSCEDDQDEVHIRLKNIAKVHNITLGEIGDNLGLCYRVGQDNMLVQYGTRIITHSPFFQSLINTIKVEGFEFVILDNIANLYGGDENNRIEVTAFMTAIYKLCEQTGVTILLLGHPNKSGAGFSGSTAWDAAVRQRLLIENEGDKYYLACKKANYLPKGLKIEMTKNTDGVFIEEFANDDDKPSLDIERLKTLIWEEIKAMNGRKQPISFSKNALTYYEKIFRYGGTLKPYPTKMIHEAVTTLRMEGKLTTEGASQKIMALG